MEKEPNKPEGTGFNLDGMWVTPDFSKIIRFQEDPMCDHLEVDVGGEYPMAYVINPDAYDTLADYGWEVWTYERASEQMKEFMVELHLGNLNAELLNWHSENP